MASSPFRSILRRQLQLAFRPRHQIRAQSSSPNSSHTQDKISAKAPSSNLITASATKNTAAPLSIWQRLGPVTRVAQAYERSQKKRPYVTQTISSIFIFFCADLSAQSMNDDDYDPLRTVRTMIIGAGTAIPAYRWFHFLAKNFNYSSRVVSLGVKIVMNQLLFATYMNVYFFSMQALLSGDGIDGAVQRVRDTLATSWINSCKIWPIVMAFNLSFVPLEYRALFAGVVNVGWQAYLSLLNRWAEIREAEVEAVESVVESVALAEAA
ncbi:mpv17 pmp22 family [Trichoderma arundinaceum]|uniref:Mpv17 pmp22 family n=1 Tax=Trichoderma arundinaceum TaxID=490622 RepID=A0A395NQ86_TRIAR|nr:mpv17 pmp22 family [Trichoderma arundinaceum]